MNSALPTPSPQALASSQALCRLIQEDIQQNQGWIPFSHYMHLALYAPHHGYYQGGAAKFGQDGDFITAPTLTPLFGQTLAEQISALLGQTAGVVYEFGAGNGALAATLLQSLPGDTLQQYCIIEISAELAERQRQLIAQQAPHMAAKVTHLSTLPTQLDGIIIGNEVLDAMPVEIMCRQHDLVQQMGVICQGGHFDWQARTPTDPALISAATQWLPPSTLPYTSELHLQQQAFIRTLADSLVRGAIIMIDYGFDAAQYYHPQRQQGTLIGHYRHHSIHDIFHYPGLTDLTAHVNFTAIADTAVNHGLDLIGYTTQAHFLMNLGITDKLAAIAPSDQTAYIQAAGACQVLLSQHEMGELFKVMALGKNIDIDWAGFSRGDLCHKL